MNKRFNVISIIGDKKTRIPIRDIENETIGSLIKKIEKRNVFTDDTIFALKTKTGEWLFNEDYVTDLLNHGDTVVCVVKPPPYPLCEDVLLKFSQFDPPSFPLTLQPNSFEEAEVEVGTEVEKDQEKTDILIYGAENGNQNSKENQQQVQTKLFKKTETKLKAQTIVNKYTDEKKVKKFKNPNDRFLKNGFENNIEINHFRQKKLAIEKQNFNKKRVNKLNEGNLVDEKDINSMKAIPFLPAQIEQVGKNKVDEATLNENEQEKENTLMHGNTKKTAQTKLEQKLPQKNNKITNSKKEKENQNNRKKEPTIPKGSQQKQIQSQKKTQNQELLNKSRLNNRCEEIKETNYSLLLKSNMKSDNINIDLSDEIFEKINLKKRNQHKKKNVNRYSTPQPKKHKKNLLDPQLYDPKANLQHQKFKNKLKLTQSIWEDLSIQNQKRKVANKNQSLNKLIVKKNLKKHINVNKNNQTIHKHEDQNVKKIMKKKIDIKKITKRVCCEDSDLDESTWEEINFYNSIEKDRRLKTNIKNNLYTFTHLIDQTIPSDGNQLLKKNNSERVKRSFDGERLNEESRCQNMALNNNNNLNKFNEKNNSNQIKKISYHRNKNNNNRIKNKNPKKANKIIIEKNLGLNKKKSKLKAKNKIQKTGKFANIPNKNIYQNLPSSGWVELVQPNQRNQKSWSNSDRGNQNSCKNKKINQKKKKKKKKYI
ncbi:hypothetical protein M0813_25221 [Anaeramoeba flamelloides]|uniref:Uncharacterized protein n=1 Tax=Anaeramoeba flamelloides TaxID=1746091 RepID=A0ABQ8Y3D2_9EUKA|nr:hypothetical protein M0813_25221 [Anaeramoeba flamelloides]